MNRFCLLTFLTFYLAITFDIGYKVGGKLILISQGLQGVNLRPILEKLEKTK